LTATSFIPENAAARYGNVIFGDWLSPTGMQAKDSAGRVKHLVRGYRDSDYHVYAARPTVEELRGKGFSATVLGGGRLLHSPTNNLLRIWGRSHSFGREDKTVTVAVCQERWPNYNITWSNDGY
jgi:phosphohistidine phosphatase